MTINLLCASRRIRTALQQSIVIAHSDSHSNAHIQQTIFVCFLSSVAPPCFPDAEMIDFFKLLCGNQDHGLSVNPMVISTIDVLA